VLEDEGGIVSSQGVDVDNYRDSLMTLRDTFDLNLLLDEVVVLLPTSDQLERTIRDVADEVEVPEAKVRRNLFVVSGWQG
jgi:hypothetical protein